jgi:hypothetical protein
MAKCKNPNCKDKFKPKYFLQKHCMEKEECIALEIEMKKATIWKEKRAEWKEDLKTKGDWIKVLQITFNTFIRVRDKELPCISCLKTKVEEFHAGHYIATTYQYHRFNEDNVHKQCSQCNTHLRGNLIPYRIELIKRIGLDRVQYLENTRHMMLELTIPEIQELIKEYKFKTKELKK